MNKVQLVLKVLLVNKVQQVLKVKLEIKDHSVYKEVQERRAQRELLVIKVQ